MPRKRTHIEKAAGKLISIIQKEWGNELGEPYAELSENVMNTAHDFLQAGTANKIKEILGSLTISQYLGEDWVQTHPNVVPAIMSLEEEITRNNWGQVQINPEK